MSRVLLSFNTAALPDNAQIKSAKLRIYITGKTSSQGLTANVNFYKFNGVADGSYSWALDCFKYIEPDPNYFGKTSVIWDDVIANSWYEVELNSQGIAEINRTGWSAMWARSVIEAIGGQPAWVSSGYTRIAIATQSSANDPELVVSYVGDISTRTVDVPANAGAGGSGNDLSGILWETPRCAWNDETPVFEIDGEAGCPFKAKITNGTLTIAEITDVALKSNGKYYWNPALGSYTGKFRCEATETTSGHTDTEVSTWGYSQEFSGIESCISQAKYMEESSASWLRAESEYRIASTTEPLVFYWTSDMVAGDIATSALDIKQGGASQASVYNSTLADLLDNYYECADSANDALISSRYILASMGEVDDDLDGLIVDLSKPLINANKGFYYVQISQDGISALTPVSAYLYYDTGEFKITKTYNAGKYDIGITNNINIGFQTHLSQVTVTVSGASDNKIYKTVEDTLNSSAKTVEFDFTSNGQFVPKLELWTSGEDYRYTRIWNDNLEAGKEKGGGGGLPGGWGDWWGWLMTDAGRWVLLIAAIAIEALIFRNQKAIGIILGLAFVGLWIVLKWVDLWLVVLLALGAGFTVWAMLRRKTQGGGAE